MKVNHIHDAIGLLDDELLEEANRKRIKHKRNIIQPTIVLTMCLCLIFVLYPKQSYPGTGATIESIITSIKLPYLQTLHVSKEDFIGTMGYPSFYGYSIDDVKKEYPWSNTSFLTLPVYQNLSCQLDGLPYPGIGEKKMRETLDFLLKELNQDLVSLETESSLNYGSTYESLEERIMSLKATTNEMMILIAANNLVRIEFKEPLSIEQGLFSFIENYHEILGLEEPQIIENKVYSFNGDYHMEYYAYDQSNDLKQTMLNYYTKKINFHIDENKLYSLTIQDDLSVANKLGDYPIISQNKALQTLLEGNYIDVTGENKKQVEYESIEDIALVYHISNTVKTWIPYYQFTVEISNDSLNQLKEYSYYYVPAIPLQYLDHSSIWDGNIN